MIPDTTSLSATVGFDLLGEDLGKDARRALSIALGNGAIFPNANDPLSIFREVLSMSIRDIQSHPRGRLFQGFLLKGPYEGEGDVPKTLVDKRLSDTDTASAITFIHSFMVNSFKGAVTELLASAACVKLVQQLRQSGDIPSDALVFVGDTVKIYRPRHRGTSKGADIHILVVDHRQSQAKKIAIVGVAEVKSYFPSQFRLREQLKQHIERTKNGLNIVGEGYPGESVSVGFGPSQRVLNISIVPNDWLLPRTFRFETSKHGRTLHVDTGFPSCTEDEIKRTDEDEWRITLRWSKEALAAAAYEMTFWYMEKAGEIIYSNGVPEEWKEMDPAEAGRNTVKMMLYDAILRCRNRRENQRAIALYNCYGFGYALGMNFRNAEGNREMLWPEDLDEIISSGKTASGCSIHQAIHQVSGQPINRPGFPNPRR